MSDASAPVPAAAQPDADAAADVDVDIDVDEEDDEFAPEDFDDDPTDTRPRSTIKRTGLGGQMIGAAMLGLAEVLEPKQKPRIAAIVDHPGDPLDLDRRGLDETFGNDGARLKGPPLDEVKSRAPGGRPVKRRR